MSVTVRKPSSASSWLVRKARQIGASLIAAGRGAKRAVLEGFIIQATTNGKTAMVYVLDMPYQLALCQPYLVEWPQASGSYVVSMWRRMDLLQGRDPVEVETYRTLEANVDVTDAGNMRYIWSFRSLRIGAAPEDGTNTYARGLFNVTPEGDAISLASVLGDDETQWVLVARINAKQSVLPLSASPDVEPTATPERSRNVMVSATSLDAALRPEYGTSLTVAPSANTHGDMGVFCTNTFVENPAPGTFDTPFIVGAVVARYRIDGEFSIEDDPREATLEWVEHIDTTDLPYPLTGGNVHLTRLATAPDGTGVFTAVVRKVLEWDNEGVPSADVVRGIVTANITALGIGPVSVGEVGSLFVDEDPEVFTNTPIVGVYGANGPAMVCHRVRELRDGSTRLRQDADDIGLSVVAHGAGVAVDLGDYFPITYTPRDEVMADGRITTGLWDYPLGTGEWSVQHVQSACQCGADELAVLVRPKAQFLDPTTDIHVAIVRISTGELIAVGPATLRGSLYMHASVTCWQQGSWDGVYELVPAKLLINLFREAGAPAETETIARGTYHSFDSGRTTKLIVAVGATLVYAMGSPLRAMRLGG